MTYHRRAQLPRIIGRGLATGLVFVVCVGTFGFSDADTQSPPSDLRTRIDGVDWSTFLGPAGDQKSPETGIHTGWTEGTPRLVWYQEVGEGYSAPVVSRGRLFHFDRVGDEARLRCLESETGRLLWEVTYPTDYEDYYGYSNGPRTSPVVDEDRVYTFGVEGRLRSHRVNDGTLLWDVDTTEQFGVVKNFFGVGSTPVIEGDLLITQVGGSPPGSPKIHSGEVRGNGTGVVAFDKLTGEVRYALSDELASYASIALATIDERRWGFAFTRGGLLGFDPEKGRQEFFFPWRAKILESVNASTPVVVEDTILISESYGPGAALLRVENGGYEVVWQDPPGRGQALQTHWNTPVHHEGFVYASSGQNSGNAELRCVELATGKVRWSQKGFQRATLLYVDGYLVVLSENGQLRLVRVNAERYDEVAMVDLSQATVPRAAIAGENTAGEESRPLITRPAWNAPVLAHGLLYVRGKDTLVALELIAPPTTAESR